MSIRQMCRTQTEILFFTTDSSLNAYAERICYVRGFNSKNFVELRVCFFYLILFKSPFLVNPLRERIHKRRALFAHKLQKVAHIVRQWSAKFYRLLRLRVCDRQSPGMQRLARKALDLRVSRLRCAAPAVFSIETVAHQRISEIR